MALSFKMSPLTRNQYLAQVCRQRIIQSAAIVFPKKPAWTWPASILSGIRSLSTRQSTSEVRIVEVGPRDGLQNESQLISVEDKVKLITGLVDAGLTSIEAGSFVSPKWVPKMANTTQVMEKLQDWKSMNPTSQVEFSCLVPNLKGLEQASQVQSVVDEIAVFGAASEAFSHRNINCSIDDSLERFQLVTDSVSASYPKIKIRGYLSCVIACPYDGRISPSQVANVAEKMFDKLQCHELSLGDTIGIGTPGQTIEMLEAVESAIGRENMSRIAVHFHDTYGQALANIFASLDRFDIKTIDSSVAGLGGCPYANGASGNVATEDVVYMLEGMGVKTGIDLEKLVKVGKYISTDVLGKETGSKVARAMLSKQQL